MTEDALNLTLTALCGNYTLDVGEHVRTIGTSLPGNAVCAILPDLGDGITRVVYDLDKPYALAHARAMLCEWWERKHGLELAPLHADEPIAFAFAGYPSASSIASAAASPALGSM